MISLYLVIFSIVLWLLENLFFCFFLLSLVVLFFRSTDDGGKKFLFIYKFTQWKKMYILKIYSILLKHLDFFIRSWKKFSCLFSPKIHFHISRRISNCKKIEKKSEEIVIFSLSHSFCNNPKILKLCVIESNESTDKRKSH